MPGEISLTGATLTSSMLSPGSSIPPPPPKDPLAGAAAPHDDHNHSHEHNHHRHGDGSPPPQRQPPMMTTASIPELVEKSSDEEILVAICRLVRFGGPLNMVDTLIQTWRRQKQSRASELLRNYGDADSGHSLLHWATKRDVTFVDYFCNLDCSPVRASTDATQMSPLHWACTLPSRAVALPMIQRMSKVTSGSSSVESIWEVRDSAACTPLLIAAQHGHTDTVAYLVQKGSQVSALDKHRDSAVHWAAYKGSIEVLGLLWYYRQQLRPFWTAPDAFGQTPLHLASLRGHAPACRYLLSLLDRSEASMVLRHKDVNGRTPYELAVHKKQNLVAVVLRVAQERVLAATNNNSSDQAWQKRWSRNVASQKRFCTFDTLLAWCGGTVELDEAEAPPTFPYYYVWLQIFGHIWFQFTIFYPVADGGRGELWDSIGLGIISWILICIVIFFLLQTSRTNPGRLDDKHPRISYWRGLYEKTLEAYANDATSDEEALILCHTCHIARPPRSKHDRFSGACVECFDHMCPFVGNTVGLYNYPYFFGFCLCLTIYFVFFWAELITFWSRMSADTHWLNIAVGLIMGVHIVFPGGMVVYHSQLSWINLTTNEHINTRKYGYLWETVRPADPSRNLPPTKRYFNPWKKSGWQNLWNRMHPSELAYMLPGGVQLDVNKQSEAPLLKHDEFNSPV